MAYCLSLITSVSVMSQLSRRWAWAKILNFETTSRYYSCLTCTGRKPPPIRYGVGIAMTSKVVGKLISPKSSQQPPHCQRTSLLVADKYSGLKFYDNGNNTNDRQNNWSVFTGKTICRQ